MQFIHQPLTWGFLAMLLPLLIHLINMLRHKRIEWAAMEFLLKSYKKHRKWIWLKQLLLLLMRMAAIGLLVAMLAQWVSKKQWFSVFGGQVTHHYVLVDDSLSMSERGGAVSAFDRAEQVVAGIVTKALEQESSQRLTLLRYSRAARAGEQEATDEAIGKIADFNAAVIDPQFKADFEENKGIAFAATPLRVGPLAALNLTTQLLEEESDEQRIVYLVSDFRSNDWENPTEVREQLRRARQAGADVRLISCVRQAQPNLLVSDIAAGNDTRAAGVPLFVDVTVKNTGQQTATDVKLTVETFRYEDATEFYESPERLSREAETLPTVLINEIAPGESVTRQVQVYFSVPGKHVIRATLADDALMLDNRRWAAFDFPAGEQALIINGSGDLDAALFLPTAFQPSPRANTGIQAEVKADVFLRDSHADELSGYQSIHLLDVGRLDDRAIENLEQYVQDGGGVSFFVGDQTIAAFYNSKLYRNGEGLFPLPLGRDNYLPPDPIEDTPDIKVQDHPLFHSLMLQRHPLHNYVTVERYFEPEEGWQPAPDSTVRVIATLRNDAPLVVERKFGNGRVLAFLTSASPTWNNLALDPTFVVIALKMHAYLSAAQRHDDEYVVGQPVPLSLEPAKYLPDVSFVVPSEDAGQRGLVETLATQASVESATRAVALDGNAGETDRPGIYEAWPRTADGQNQVRRWAMNVDTLESQVAVVEPAALLDNLDTVKPRFFYAEELDVQQSRQAGLNRSELLMWLLLVLLLAEQALAYSASYHPLRGGAR